MISPIMRALHIGFWWLATRLYPTQVVKGLRLVVVTALPPDAIAAIQATLGGAMDDIAHAQGGFGELVGSHLRLVAVLGDRHSYASPAVRAYISSFKGHERTSARYLACQLVWAATFVRLSRDARAFGTGTGNATIRRAAYDSQILYVSQFDDGPEWVRYLEANTPEM